MVASKLDIRLGDEFLSVPVTRVHTLVLGSGAAGLNAAAQLVLNGVKDVMILTEGLSMGTSINTGSDKQTYYKLSMCGADADSPRDMAETYFANGSMHGDLALVESSLSARTFINLVNLGVPFPRDEYGQFVGYKTDHDPRQRATSIGPYTSREMCLRLIDQVKALNIPIREKRNAVQLILLPGEETRVAGLVAITNEGDFEVYLCENLVFAVGGPGGLYQTSVYPPVHSGAIGLGLMAGACASNLAESQYGLASIKYRWNVSGTYMQVIPRVISRAADGISDEREFMADYFTSIGEMNGKVFLKGYQWPFDARKVIGGSSIVDILVYIESILKNRRVYLDFRANPTGYLLNDLPEEARSYLEKSGATQATPIERLIHMNPGAVELYHKHSIDLKTEPLEVAICAQHNNGGLAGNLWYESTNIKHLFPVGEVNGSHGVTRPGGSALNAGQVGSLRAAEFIANRYKDWTLPEQAQEVAQIELQKVVTWAGTCLASNMPWLKEMQKLQSRMSKAGAHVRSMNILEKETPAAWQQVASLEKEGCAVKGKDQLRYAFRTRQLAFAQAMYLDTIRFVLQSNVGSRGSSIVLDEAGKQIHPLLDASWKIAVEDERFRKQVLESVYEETGQVKHQWIPCRPIPETDAWFENIWAKFREGKIYE